MADDWAGIKEKALAEKERKSTNKAKSAQDIAKAFAGTSSSGGGVKDPLIFLGWQKAATPPGPYAPGYELPFFMNQAPKTASLSQVASQYYDWDQGMKDKFLSQLSLAGYDTTKMRDADVAQMWGQYSQQAAAYYRNGAGQNVTPWDILAKDRAQREAYLKTPRTETQTSTQVQLSTSQDAHAIFLQAAKSLLGRDPTKNEIKTFQAALNAYEKANPQQVTTTSQYVGDTLKSQSQVSSGGVSAEARGLMAMEDIKKDPEYGAHQAATNGMNWLMEMVQGG